MIRSESDGRLAAVPRVRTAAGMSRDIRAWLFPVAVITMLGAGAGILTAGLPGGAAGVSTVALLVLATALTVVALSERIRDLRVVVPALVGVGLCGAGLDWQADGPGFMAGYVALVGLALRTPRRIALLAGSVVMAAVTAEGAYESDNPTTASLAVLFAFALLFTTSVFAAVSLDGHRQAEVLLARESAAGEARQRAAALAERSRLARDLHDVLAHSLAALAVQLEATRMTAITTGSEPGWWARSPPPATWPASACSTPGVPCTRCGQTRLPGRPACPPWSRGPPRCWAFRSRWRWTACRAGWILRPG